MTTAETIEPSRDFSEGKLRSAADKFRQKLLLKRKRERAERKKESRRAQQRDAKTMRNFERLILQEFDGDEMAAAFLREQRRLIFLDVKRKRITEDKGEALFRLNLEANCVLQGRVALKHAVETLRRRIESKASARDKLEAEYQGLHLLITLNLLSDCAEGRDFHATPLGTVPADKCHVCRLSKVLLGETQ